MNFEELQSVCNNVRYLKIEPGETIYKQKDNAESAYIILKGMVQV